MRSMFRRGVVFFFLCHSILGATRGFAADDGLIQSLRSVPFTPSETRREQPPVLLGDRLEYRDDDPTGQFYLVLPKPAEIKGCTIAVAIRAADAQNDLGAATLADPANPKAHFLVSVGKLKPGRYTVTGSLRDAKGETVGQSLTFSFARTAGPAHPAIAFPADGIPVQLPSESWVKSASWPTRAAVPLPVGAVTDVKQLALLEDGQPVPADITSVGTWHVGGSIKWVHIQFVARFKDDGSPRDYRLKLLPQIAPPPQSPLKVEKSDDKIVVDTGAIKFEVNRKAFAGIEKASLAGKPVTDGPGGPTLVDGRAIRWDAALDKEAIVEVEDAGSASVTIVARGWYRTAGDQRVPPICQFVTRLTAYANQPMVRVRHQTMLAYDTRTQFIKELGFRIATPIGTRYEMGIDGKTLAGALSQDAKAPGISLHQDRADHLRILGDETAKTPLEGKRTDGWFSIAGAEGSADAPRLTVFVRDAWQRFPKEVELSHSGVTLYSWPKHGHRAFALDDELAIGNIYKFWCFHQGTLLDLNLPGDYFDKLKEYPGTQECIPEHALNGNGEGLSIPEDFSILFSDGRATADAMANTAKLFDADPTGLSPAKWNAETGAMGKMAAVDREHFAPLEDAIEKGFLSYTRSVERGGDYGLFNYADVHTYWDPINNRADLHRVWHNSHYHEVGLTWLLYFRSGSRDLLRWARASTTHYINVDTVNFALPNDPVRDIKFHVPGAMYHCKGLTHWGSEARGMEKRDTHAGIWGHWVDPDAMLWAWYLDGDRHARDVYDMWHASLMQYGLPVEGVRREINTSLAITCELYNATLDADLLPNIYGMGKSLREREPLENQNPGPMWHPMWVNRYIDLTRDPAYNEWILHYGKFDGIGSSMLGIASLAYEHTGDASFLTHQFEQLSWFPRKCYQVSDDDPYAWFGIGPGPLGSNWWWDTWPYFLEQIHRAKIDRIPDPAVGRGYCLYSPQSFTVAGSPPSLQVLILQKTDRPLTLNTGSDFRHHGGVRIFSPSGKLLLQEERKSELLTGDAMRTFPADGETGIYSVEMRSHWSATFLPLSDEPNEAAVINMGQEYKSILSGRYYVLPLDVKGTIKLHLLIERNDQPADYLIQDANGKAIAHGNLFVARNRKEATVDLDASLHPAPWAVDIVGDVRVTFGEEKQGVLLWGQSPQQVQTMAEPARQYLKR